MAAPDPSGGYHFVARLKRRARHRFKNMSPDERRQFISHFRDRGMGISAFAAAATNGVVNPTLVAAEAREGLGQFLGTFGPRTLGPTGTLESLTLLEDSTDSCRYVARYLVAFAGGVKMIWTVVHASDGGVSLDGSYQAPPPPGESSTNRR